MEDRQPTARMTKLNVPAKETLYVYLYHIRGPPARHKKRGKSQNDAGNVLELAPTVIVCVWCGKLHTHIIDDLYLCCFCFDVLIEHSGNIKSEWLPETSLAMDRHGCWHRLARERLTEWKERHEREKKLRPHLTPKRKES